MARSKPKPVDWKPLDEQVQARKAQFNGNAAGNVLFRTSVDHGQGSNPKPLLDAYLPVIEDAIRDGRSTIALALTAQCIGELCARIDALAKALNAAKPRVRHSVMATEKGAPAARKKHSENTEARYATIRGKVQSVLYSNPRNTITYAREQVAKEVDEHGEPLQSLRTVKTATVGMKSPPRKKKK